MSEITELCHHPFIPGVFHSPTVIIRSSPFVLLFVLNGSLNFLLGKRHSIQNAAQVQVLGSSDFKGQNTEMANYILPGGREMAASEVDYRDVDGREKERMNQR